MATTTKETVRDFYGRIIGSLETVHDKNPLYDGDVTARDFYGRILGYYRKHRNVTTDFYGRIIGNGDLTSGLIYKANDERRNNGQK